MRVVTDAVTRGLPGVRYCPASPGGYGLDVWDISELHLMQPGFVLVVRGSYPAAEALADDVVRLAPDEELGDVVAYDLAGLACGIQARLI